MNDDFATLIVGIIFGIIIGMLFGAHLEDNYIQNKLENKQTITTDKCYAQYSAVRRFAK